MTIFSMAVCFSGVFAWYASMRSLNNDSDEFKVVDVGSSVKTISIHEYYGKSATDYDAVTTDIAASSATAIPNYSLPSGTKYVHVVTDATATHNLSFTVGSNTVSIASGNLKDINNQTITPSDEDFVIDLVKSSLIASNDVVNAHTLQTAHDTAAAAFSITLSKYYPECFAFNRNGVNLFEDGEATGSMSEVTLGQYSLDAPDQPILMLFEVDGGYTRIELETEFPFLGNKKSSYVDYMVNTKTQLNEITGMSNGDFADVLSDESRSYKTTLYKYNGSSWVSTYSTVATYSALEALDKTNLSNGDYIYVESDENFNNVGSIYQYLATPNKYDVKWIDLGIEDEMTRHFTNPLSSVSKFSYLEFASNNDYETTLDVYMKNNQGITTRYTNVACNAVQIEQISDSNTVSFADCSDFSNPEYYNEICIYAGDTRGLRYIGIVLNYNALALEYIFSNNLGHEALSYGLTFQCDWTTKV